jgi:Uncharacterized homolog of gamma-carboxymuconolactone decarboxylase subunit
MSVKLPWFVEKYQEIDPEYGRVVGEVTTRAMQTQALDDKTKHLVVLALDALKGADEGVRVVAGQAREAGATEQEIQEVLRLAYFAGSMSLVKTFLNAYK